MTSGCVESREIKRAMRGLLYQACRKNLCAPSVEQRGVCGVGSASGVGVESRVESHYSILPTNFNKERKMADDGVDSAPLLAEDTSSANASQGKAITEYSSLQWVLILIMDMIGAIAVSLRKKE